MAERSELGEYKDLKLPAGTIRYREAGEGRPIVFVHGYLVNGTLWNSLAELLASGHRCIVPDWPMGSHGVAMNADADLAPQAMADLIAGFIEKLDLTDVVLVGNDSGGAVCQLLVTSHPERIGALVLTPCDAFEDFPPSLFKPLGTIARVPGLRSFALQPLRLTFARKVLWRMLVKSPYDAELAESWFAPGLRDAAVLRDGAKFAAGIKPKLTLDAAERLTGFRKPALLAWPPETKFFTWKLAQRLADTIPNARLEPVPGGLAFVSIDQPERLNELISEFAAEGAS